MMKRIISLRSIVLGTMLLMSCCLWAQEADSEWFTSGKKAYVGQDLELAKSMFLREVQSNPTNGRAWMYLAAVYRDTEVNDSIVYAANYAIKHLPKDDTENLTQSYVVRGYGRLMNEDFESALSDFQTARGIDPLEPVSYLYAMFALDRLGKSEEATEQLKDMLRVPGCDKAGGLALLATRVKDENPTMALEYVDKAIELDRTTPEYYGVRGNIKLQMGRDQEGVEDLVHAYSLDANPNHSETVSTHATSDEMVAMITAAIERERITHGNQAAWEYLLGNVYKNAGNDAEALRHSIRATRLSPTLLSLSRLANKLCSLYLYDEAIYFCKRVLAQADPVEDELYYYDANEVLTDCYLHTSQEEKAIEIFKEKIKNSDEPKEDDIAILALLQYHAGKYAEAIATWKELPRDEPFPQEIILVEAKIKRENGLKDEARQLFLSVAEDEKAKLEERSEAYALAGDKVNAEKFYKQWLEKTGSVEEGDWYASDYYRKAVLTLAMGDRAMAVNSLRKCLKINPDMIKTMAPDLDFLSLHGYPDYEKLIREYTEANERKTAPLRSIVVEEWPEYGKK